MKTPCELGVKPVAEFASMSVEDAVLLALGEGGEYGTELLLRVSVDRRVRARIGPTNIDSRPASDQSM